MSNGQSSVPDGFNRLAAELRPKLLRYCARMTGSVIDGEDVVQEALLKAMDAIRDMDSVAQPKAWLFRIAHNAAVDFLRRRAREATHIKDEPLEMIENPVDEIAQRQAAEAGLRTFMRLPTSERSSVILMDVLGHSLREVAEVLDTTIPTVKAALHRGRQRLREFAQQPEHLPLRAMSRHDRELLTAYIDRFNARDFDAVRRMIADDVRLELVGRSRLRGRTEVSRYFGNYSTRTDWELSLGFIDRRPAVLVRQPGDPAGSLAHFVLLSFEDQEIMTIRDYRYAAYVAAEAEIIYGDTLLNQDN